MYRVSSYVRLFAAALVLGAVIATAWVNLSPDIYYDAIEYRLADLPLPGWLWPWNLTLTPMGLVSDVLMPLFLFVIGKELWEALVLEKGALAGKARLALPLGAVIGGSLGAVVVWMTATYLSGSSGEETTPLVGWSLPIGSDVILCYAAGRMVFGRNHPALHLLLLISIGFDILGLLMTGLANPRADLRLGWLVLSGLALVLVWRLSSRHARPDASEAEHRRAAKLWPYVLAGIATWAGVALAGLPPVLGLLPLLPVIPHADRSFGLFAEAEVLLHDPLNRLAHALIPVVTPILFLFGLTRGGVQIQAFGPETLEALAALWIGKPLGLFLGALLSVYLTQQSLGPGLRLAHVALIALLSGIGFTVPVLALGTALPGGTMAEAARLGLACSLFIVPVALIASRLFLRRE